MPLASRFGAERVERAARGSARRASLRRSMSSACPGSREARFGAPYPSPSVALAPEASAEGRWASPCSCTPARLRAGHMNAYGFGEDRLGGRSRKSAACQRMPRPSRRDGLASACWPAFAGSLASRLGAMSLDVGGSSAHLRFGGDVGFGGPTLSITRQGHEGHVASRDEGGLERRKIL